MRAPLTVRVSDGVRDRHVTRYVRGLSFTKTAPGGHHSATVNLEAPAGFLADLGPADRLFVYDGRNASTVWDGYVENPGRQSVAGGETFDVSALGGVVLASDNARAVVFIDRDLSHSYWRPTANKGAQIGVDRGTTSVGQPGIKIEWPSGTDLSAGTIAATMRNTLLELTGQPLSMAAVTTIGGKVDGNLRAFVQPSGGSGFSFTTPTLTTTPTAFTIKAGTNWTFVTDPVTSTKNYSLVLEYTVPGGGVTVSDDSTFALWRDVVTVPALKNAVGTHVQNFNTYVLASSVVAHLIGEGMLSVDAATAVVEASTTQINQLAYLDGVMPGAILDDLSLYEPDFLWEILESNAAGKHRFAYRAWPTTPRYEINGREFVESGGEVDLSNRVLVNWTDEAGSKRTTIRTTTVPELGARVKDAAPVTLPDGLGSEANAIRIGDEILASLNTPTRSGTATIRRPIHDKLTGRMAMPWEIEPGYLVRVRDLGVDLRLTEMTYDDANVAATLTLGSPVLTSEQRIARLRSR